MLSQEKISLLLKILRTECGVKQEELARLLHVSRQAYSNYETGARCLPAEFFPLLAEYYGLSIDEFLQLSETIDETDPNLSSTTFTTLSGATDFNYSDDPTVPTTTALHDTGNVYGRAAASRIKYLLTNREEILLTRYRSLPQKSRNALSAFLDTLE